MSNSKIPKCRNISLLNNYISKCATNIDDTLPNGHRKYTFGKAVVSIYETTGTVVLQGKDNNQEIKNKIIEKIKAINSLEEPICSTNE